MRLPILLALLVAAPPEELRVLDAVYGNPERGRMCDATEPVAQQCDGRETCAIAVSNGMCGDPDFGVPKRLFITFKCGRLPAQTIAIGEATVIRLACDAGRPPAPPAAPGQGRPASPAQGAAFRMVPLRWPAAQPAVASVAEMVETLPLLPANVDRLGARYAAVLAGGPAPPP